MTDSALVATAEPEATVGGEPARTHVHPTLALAVIACAQLMVVLDATIVNIALPNIQRALGFSPTSLAWVLNAYTLTFGGLLLLGGRAGDILGRRRMFIGGVLLFTLASFAGGLATSEAWLLAARALQGVGGAIASPTALSLVTTTFEEGPERNRAFGVYAAVSGAGAAIGLIAGGLLTDYLSWRWVLFVNVPIGITLAVATPFVLPESERVRGHFDLPGALTSTLGLAALVYGFIHAASDGWNEPVTLASFDVAIVLLSWFLFIEARSTQPLMPLRLFRNRSRSGSYVVMLTVGAAMFGMFFFLTQFVQDILGYSPVKAGLAFLPVSAVIVVAAQAASILISRVGPRPLMVAGTALAAIGLFLLSRLSVQSSYLPDTVVPMIIVAVGMGTLFVSVTMTAVSKVADEDAGIASAMLNVQQQVGGALGLSVLVTVFSTAFHHDLTRQAAKLAAPPTHQVQQAIAAHATASGMTAGFLGGACLAVVGLVASVLLVKARKEDLDAKGGMPGMG